jgi:hypothetical protein
MKQQLTIRKNHNSVLYCVSLFTAIFISLLFICSLLKAYNHAIFQVAFIYYRMDIMDVF